MGVQHMTGYAVSVDIVAAQMPLHAPLVGSQRVGVRARLAPMNQRDRVRTQRRRLDVIQFNNNSRITAEERFL